MAWAIVFALVILPACGGGTPTAPASVVNPPANGGGNPTPEPTLAFTFVTLGEESMGKASSDLPLWGLRGQNSTDAVMQMVFGDNSGPSNPGLHVLGRVTGPVSLSIPDSLSGKMGGFELGASAWSELTRFSMTLVTGPSNFSVEIDPTIASPALTRRTKDGSGNIIRATVVLRSVDNATLHTILHELAHLFGMDHHAGFGILGLSFDANRIAYSMSERDNASMMVRLAPGTSSSGAPPTTSLSFGRETTETIVCQLGRR